jgi:hypothetical protein
MVEGVLEFKDSANFVRGLRLIEFSISDTLL